METDIFNLKSDKLFPFQFQLFGFVIGFVGLLCLAFAPLISPVLILLAVLIFTARRGIEFDRKTKSYRIYNAFFFWKKGHAEPYDSFEKIYIHHARLSQKVYTMNTTGITSRSAVYDAYLKTADGSRIYLLSHKNKDVLIKKLLPLEDFLKLKIFH